ncbi:tetratricopeptide repeat protein [Amycolatopsis sp. lyj-346]|uniref:tetratricopeptide repeat protein n=1 Tax=Amycolatopsis sp. lyj-346 TaxID=2789289 RepID=UPI00397D2555
MSFFVTARLASQNDRNAFIDNVMEQLLALLGETMPPFMTESTREAHLLGLLTEAAECCHRRGEQFLLLVDGLDEDRGEHDSSDSHSIAALLPAELPAGMRAIVASRPNPPIPTDVPAFHPLHDQSVIHRLAPSPKAQATRTAMERELKRLLRSTVAEQDLLGLVAAAGGGLSSPDLAELTGSSTWDIDDHLRTVTGRTFSVRNSHISPDGANVFLLGHEQLQVTALEMLGERRMIGYRERIHAWAGQYQEKQWPPETPEYLLHGYFHMLQAAGDARRMTDCATDIARQDRMLSLSGGDALILTEIAATQSMIANQTEPALAEMIRLSIHRDHLLARNRSIPTELPAAWAALGQIKRAESLIKSIPKPEDRIYASIFAAASLKQQHGATEEIRELLGTAEATAAAVASRPGDHADVLYAAVEALINFDNIDRAEILARSIHWPSGKPSGLELVIDNLIHVGEVEHAEAIAQSITDPNSKARALGSVVKAISKAGHIEHAEAIAASSNYSVFQVRLLATISKTLIEFGKHKQASKLLERAETIAGSAAPFEQVQALASIAVTLAFAGNSNELNKITERAETLAYAAPRPERIQMLVTVAETLATIGNCSRSEAVARLVPDADWRAESLILAIRSFLKSNDVDRAEAIAMGIPGLFYRVQALIPVAEALAETNQVDHAETLAYSIKNRFGRSEMLASIATSLIKTGNLLRAESVAIRIISDPEKMYILELLAGAFAKSGDFSRALKIAHLTDDPSQQAQILTSVARAMTIINDREAANDVLQRSEKLARSVNNLERETKELISLADKLTSANLHSQARTVIDRTKTEVDRIADLEIRARAQVSIADVLVKLGDLTQAEMMARSIAIQSYRGKALGSIVEKLAKVGLLSQAESLIKSTDDYGEQVKMLVSLAEGMSKSSKRAHSQETLERALNMVLSRYDDPSKHNELLTLILVGFIRIRHLEPAAQIARIMSPGEMQSTAAATAIEAMIEAGMTRDAERLARSIVDPIGQTHAQISIARKLAKSNNNNRLADLVQKVISITRSRASASDLELLIQPLIKAVAENCDMRSVDTIVQSIADPVLQVQALTWAAEATSLTKSRDQPHKLLDQAEAIARAITDHGDSGLALDILTEELVRQDRLDHAEEVARSIAGGDWQIDALSVVADALFKAEETDRAEAVTRSIPDSDIQSQLLIKATRNCARHRRVQALAEALRNSSWHQAAPDVIQVEPDTMTVIIEELDRLALQRQH